MCDCKAQLEHKPLWHRGSLSSTVDLPKRDAKCEGKTERHRACAPEKEIRTSMPDEIPLRFFIKRDTAREIGPNRGTIPFTAVFDEAFPLILTGILEKQEYCKVVKTINDFALLVNSEKKYGTAAHATITVVATLLAPLIFPIIAVAIADNRRQKRISKPINKFLATINEGLSSHGLCWTMDDLKITSCLLTNSFICCCCHLLLLFALVVVAAVVVVFVVVIAGGPWGGPHGDWLHLSPQIPQCWAQAVLSQERSKKRK